LSIELKSEDRYILEKLATELKCGNKIYDRHRITNVGEGYMSNFSSCNSNQLFDDLAKFNIIPDKSHTTDSFKNILELVDFNLIKHFLRGIIDGDGSISNRVSCGRQHAVAVYQNSLQFCKDFDSLLKLCMNRNDLKDDIKVNKRTGVYHLRYRRINDVKQILAFLYSDATVYLKRKYKRAQLYFNDLK